ncbi:MAG: low-specificity L-threonine aldolase [Bacteroidia bacterium]|jgi:threonine aldolase|nr:low-specificity L-threonine aldolase [Bacteroidia bacterium]
MKIDLRSDTLTKPTAHMLEAMMAASVGDDVYGEDESVNALQKHVANLFGKEAALFCPSGTMANQIAIKLHTQPGDELICADQSHVYKYEGGGVAFHSGVQVKLLQAERGRLAPDAVVEAINPNDPHFPTTKLVCVENTFNRGGGSCYSLEELQALYAVCKQNQLHMHIDGARIWNAMVAKGYTAEQVGKCTDTIAVCLSKGLGAPIGSLVVGSTQAITQAKRLRKLFGGGMRQAGFLAAAGMYALAHQYERIATDHAHAQLIGETLQACLPQAQLLPVETNIIIVSFEHAETADHFKTYLQTQNVIVGSISPKAIRMVFHLDIHETDVHTLQSIIQSYHV